MEEYGSPQDCEPTTDLDFFCAVLKEPEHETSHAAFDTGFVGIRNYDGLLLQGPGGK
jgi:hypothetical protein